MSCLCGLTLISNPASALAFTDRILVPDSFQTVLSWVTEGNWAHPVLRKQRICPSDLGGQRCPAPCPGLRSPHQVRPRSGPAQNLITQARRQQSQEREKKKTNFESNLICEKEEKEMEREKGNIKVVMHLEKNHKSTYTPKAGFGFTFSQPCLGPGGH